MNEKVLVIEDEQKIADAIAYALRREGYIAEVVYHGNDAIRKLQEFKPKAIILDVMLPGMDGYDILKKLQNTDQIGIIMLTAKEDIVNKILGLELGADDYMTKPFDMRELLARLKSLIRRMQKAESKKDDAEISLSGITIYESRRKAYAGNTLLDLTPKEYDLLKMLIASPDRVFTREQLLDLIWGMEYYGGTRTVDIHIQRLRKKLGPDYGEIIQTVHGIGYKVLGGKSENQHKG